MNIIKKHIVFPNVEENKKLETGEKLDDQDQWILHKE